MLISPGITLLKFDKILISDAEPDEKNLISDLIEDAEEAEKDDECNGIEHKEWTDKEEWERNVAWKTDGEDDDDEETWQALSGDKSDNEEVEKTLDFIAPPRTVIENGRKYQIVVSRTRGTRDDVIELEERLDKLLQIRQARLVGLCPIRRELYAQCFDELIRQSTLRSPERGALFLRIRDELRMTIAAHEALYESGVAYGLRKALEGECSESTLDDQILSLQAEINASQDKIKELQAKIEQIVKISTEQKAIRKAKHEEKMEYLEKANEQLKDQLEMMLKK